MKRLKVLLLNLLGMGAAARANWLHSLIHKTSINKSVSGFFDILIDCLNIGILSWSG